MASPLKLLLVAGARPNFMKVAPLIRAIQAEQNRSELKLRYRLVHTGQHYDTQMSDVFFQELGIPAPDVNLEIGSGTHAEQTAKVMLAFEPVCMDQRPDWLVVVGDINSTMACTLVAAKLGIKVAHLEAGLRSFDRSMPEEINRVVTDAVADLLLTPSPDANENLRREGVPESRILLVGNVMIDTLVANLERARRSSLPQRLGLRPKEFAYVTLHRPANVDDGHRLRRIMEALNQLTQQLPIVFPLHPRTRKMLDVYGVCPAAGPRMNLVDPVGYHDSLCLTEQAKFVLTDSGGLQEESTFLGTPCLTLRPNTERPITIEMGTNKLTSIDTLSDDIQATLQAPRSGRVPPLWDGHTAERVVAALLSRGG